MPVLKLKPACKDYLWGGRKLIEQYNKEFAGEKLAETWELSTHPDGMSEIWDTGETLRDYLKRSGQAQDLSILIKLIDARQDLSIQVHPGDDYALANEGQLGKTEVWYIVDCEEDAFLYYGFSRSVSREEFITRIREHTLTEVLNKVYVKKGDVLLIEAGTIHAIGKNILVAEIQENSNVTYRVYDYGRKDAQGKERDLHIEKALAVTDREPVAKPKSFAPHLVSCRYFTVDKLYLDGVRMQKMTGCVDDSSFLHILVTQGSGTVCNAGDTRKLQKGDSVLLPAGSGEFTLEGSLEALLTGV